MVERDTVNVEVPGSIPGSPASTCYESIENFVNNLAIQGISGDIKISLNEFAFNILRNEMYEKLRYGNKLNIGNAFHFNTAFGTVLIEKIK